MSVFSPLSVPLWSTFFPSLTLFFWRVSPKDLSFRFEQFHACHAYDYPLPSATPPKPGPCHTLPGSRAAHPPSPFSFTPTLHHPPRKPHHLPHTLSRPVFASTLRPSSPQAFTPCYYIPNPFYHCFTLHRAPRALPFPDRVALHPQRQGLLVFQRVDSGRSN